MLVLRLISLRKNDRVMKINFLNKLRIGMETSQARDKMQMLMPEFIIERISNFEIAKNFMTDDAGEISVLFCEICEFDEIIRECQSSVVEIIDEVFRNFDRFCKDFGIQKIETVGKTYMAAGGLKFIENKLPQEMTSRHFILRTIDLSKQMMQFTQTYTYRAGKHLKAKIGLHYGTSIFAVLGYHKPQFSLIGDTINTTSRVCTTGDIDNIILSNEAYSKVREIEGELIKNIKKKRDSLDRFNFIRRNVYMKGKGNIDVYILTARNPDTEQRRKNTQMKRSVILSQDELIEE